MHANLFRNPVSATPVYSVVVGAEDEVAEAVAVVEVVTGSGMVVVVAAASGT